VRVKLSRVTKLENLGIEGDFSWHRFTAVVSQHALVAPRQAEERRLVQLAVSSERYVRQVLRRRRQRRDRQ
jgi:hypothetical protein